MYPRHLYAGPCRAASPATLLRQAIPMEHRAGGGGLAALASAAGLGAAGQLPVEDGS